MKYVVYTLLLAVTALAGCKRDALEWDTRLKGPLLQTSLDFSDFIPDTLFQENGEGYLDLAYSYEETLDSISEVLNVPDTLNEVSVTLQQLLLDDRVLEDTISLGEIYPPIRLFDGQMAQIPAQNLQNAGAQEIDVTEEFFKSAKFNKGFLDLTVYNDLPVEVELIDFQLKNKTDNAIIARDQFRNILPFDSASTSISLAGKLVEGVLIGEMIELITKASNGEVLIEADKGIRLKLEVRDMEPEYATAVFPAQTLVDEDGETTYDFGGPQITVMEIKKGFVLMDIISTIEEEIIMEYTIPQSELLNDPSQPIVKEVIVPPAPPGGQIVIKDSFPIDGFKVFYSGQDKYAAPFTNTVYSRLSARIKYTGVERTLSLQDSVRIIFGLVRIEPEYAIGDFGKKTYTYTDPFRIKAFQNVRGDINLEDAEMLMTFENAFGIEAELSINSLTAVNTTDNTSVQLTSNFIHDKILIDRALNPPLIPDLTRYEFNKSNSNIKQFFEVLPDRVEANFEVVSRPNGSNDLTDFAFADSYLKTRLDFRVPMKFNANQLEIARKQPFNLENKDQLSRVKSATFTLVAINGFPFEAAFQLEFLSESDSVLTTLFDLSQRAAPGTLSGDKVAEPTRTNLQTLVDADQVRLISEATKVRIRALMNTPDNQRYPVYDTYQLDIKLLADLTYEQSQ